MRGRTLELALRRSPLDPWLGVVMRVGAMTGLGLGLALTGVGLGVAVFALDVSALWLLAAMSLCTLSFPMISLPLFALLFLQLGGRRLRIAEDEVVLSRTDGPELSRATRESVAASVRKGVYAAWGRRGRVLHLGVGKRPLAIGALEPEAADAMRREGWPVAAPPELECTPEELDRLLSLLS